MKAVSGSILPLLRDIINTSLTSAILISDFKQAVLKPLLKKADLALIFKSYRSVSNLYLVSKLTEHAVYDQLSTQLKLKILNYCNEQIKKTT